MFRIGKSIKRESRLVVSRAQELVEPGEWIQEVQVKGTRCLLMLIKMF